MGPLRGRRRGRPGRCLRPEVGAVEVSAAKATLRRWTTDRPSTWVSESWAQRVSRALPALTPKGPGGPKTRPPATPDKVSAGVLSPRPPWTAEAVARGEARPQPATVKRVVVHSDPPTPDSPPGSATSSGRGTGRRAWRRPVSDTSDASPPPQLVRSTSRKDRSQRCRHFTPDRCCAHQIAAGTPHPDIDA